MNDPCKSCGAPRCAGYDPCLCCGKCRSCGYAHATAAPTVNPLPWEVVPWQPNAPTWPGTQPVYPPSFPWLGDGFMYGTCNAAAGCAVPYPYGAVNLGTFTIGGPASA